MIYKRGIKYENFKTAYLLWALSLLCICGLNRFYTGRVGTGILFFFTFGCFGIGAIYDLFVMDNLVDSANRKKQWKHNQAMNKTLQ